ncbi:Homoserine O-acetyltransferase, partial [Haemophilus influenzae]
QLLGRLLSSGILSFLPRQKILRTF